MARKAKNNGKRASNVIVMERTMEVLRMLRIGISSGEIIGIGVEKWGIRPKMMEKYIQKATKMRRDYVLPQAQEFIRDASEKMDVLFEENYLIKDRKECRHNLLAKNKILGLDKLNVKIGGVSVDDVLLKLKEENESKK